MDFHRKEKRIQLLNQLTKYLGCVERILWLCGAHLLEKLNNKSHASLSLEIDQFLLSH